MNNFTFDSTELYNSLISAKAQITERIKAVAGTEYTVRIIWWGYEEQKWELIIVKNYSDKVEVKGKHLAQCAEEALRRLGFAQQQENLQLTHEVEAEEVAGTEDDIPF